MNNARFQALCLTCIGLVCILSSCGPKAKQADAMVTIFGQAAGVVLEYNTPLDKSSINKETFQVKGKSIMSVFVSNSNQFKNDNGKDSGRDYVYIGGSGDQCNISPDSPPLRKCEYVYEEKNYYDPDTGGMA